MSATAARDPLAGEWRERLAEDSCLVGRCWRWACRINKTGYGIVGYGRKYEQLAHRLSYRLFIGEIPEGYTIDHLCRNRDCVNPEHLEAVTLRENILRGDGMAARRARQTHCRHGHEYTPENTYVYSNGRRECRACRTIRRRHRYLETGA